MRKVVLEVGDSCAECRLRDCCPFPLNERLDVPLVSEVRIECLAREYEYIALEEMAERCDEFEVDLGVEP